MEGGLKAMTVASGIGASLPRTRAEDAVDLQLRRRPIEPRFQHGEQHAAVRWRRCR